MIRESLRYHPILIKGLTKEVVPSAGLQLPDGTHMPKGGWVGVPVLGLHRDERYYPNPDIYEPFRFVKEPRSSDEKETQQKASAYEDDLEAAKPTTTYLGFGYGRHAWYVIPPSFLPSPSSLLYSFVPPILLTNPRPTKKQPRPLVRRPNAQNDPHIHHPKLRNRVHGSRAKDASHWRRGATAHVGND